MNKKITLPISVIAVGSLKNGQWNHDRYCRGNIGIEPATVCGKLYLLPPGCPVLQVPVESILASGTHDIFYDAQIEYQENDDQDFEYKIYDGWNIVHGELITFPDPEVSLPAIDRLCYFPLGFDRDLIPARREDGNIVYAWAYTLYEIPSGARLLPDGIWPEKQIQPTK